MMCIRPRCAMTCTLIWFLLQLPIGRKANHLVECSRLRYMGNIQKFQKILSISLLQIHFSPKKKVQVWVFRKVETFSETPTSCFFGMFRWRPTAMPLGDVWDQPYVRWEGNMGATVVRFSSHGWWKCGVCLLLFVPSVVFFLSHLGRMWLLARWIENAVK